MTEEQGHASSLTFTDSALAKVLELRDAEPDAGSLALAVEVRGFRDGDYAYDVYFQQAGDAGAADWSSTQGGLTVVVPADSVDKLLGSVLDVSDDGPEAGLTIRNPNRPADHQGRPAISGPLPDLTGDVAQRIAQVLDVQVNPSIAAHGGRADLVAVEEGAAYLRLSGGCAGCGMAGVTLNQGIEVAIKQSVPEIVRIVDVTDHAAGTNPYYEPAKK
ncbi:MAG: NifU family protein [Acidimicrobiales bacterium]